MTSAPSRATGGEVTGTSSDLAAVEVWAMGEHRIAFAGVSVAQIP
jgi:hypothetical protein